MSQQDAELHDAHPENHPGYGLVRPQEARTAPPTRNGTQPPSTPSESLTAALSVPTYSQTQESLTDQLRALRVAAIRLGFYDADDWLARQDV